MKETLGKRVYLSDPDEVVNLNPGEYSWDGDILYFVAPNMEKGMIAGCNKSWIIVEHEDKTVSVTPSIEINGVEYWHGYLVRGIWKQI